MQYDGDPLHNEQIPAKVLKGICIGIKVFLIGITLLIVYYFGKNGITLETVFAFLTGRFFRSFRSLDGISHCTDWLL